MAVAGAMAASEEVPEGMASQVVVRAGKARLVAPAVRASAPLVARVAVVAALDMEDSSRQDGRYSRILY